jgi:hypothetical protein
MTFQVLAIPAEHVELIRARGFDNDHNPFEPFTDADGGAPLRCCLRNSTPGERLALIAYRPVHRSVLDVGGSPGSSPYHESGPVFVHADRCAGPAGDGYPEQWRSRPQVFRSYDREGRIRGGVVVKPGDDEDAVLAELLTDEAVAFVHTRNVVHGCFMADVRPVRG